MASIFARVLYIGRTGGQYVAVVSWVHDQAAAVAEDTVRVPITAGSAPAAVLVAAQTAVQTAAGAKLGISVALTDVTVHG